MTLYKICTPIEYSSEAWQKYCAWRERTFADFASLDSHLRDSHFTVEDDDDWNYVLTNGSYLTDIVNDLAFALRCSHRYGNTEILSFAFLEHEDPTRKILGYDILDSEFGYSLLTNFGNDIEIVNDNLADNGLVLQKEVALAVYQWFKDNMTDDAHVCDSRVFTVYETIAQQESEPDF